MAITDKEKGVWGLDQVYNKINKGSIWEYNAPGGDSASLMVVGQNSFGQLGQNNTTLYSSPVQVPGQWFGVNGSKVTTAVKSDGTLWSWGYNAVGQLGHNDRTNRSSPVQIPGTTWAESFRGDLYEETSVAVTKTDGTLWVWGDNEHGTLGLNNTTFYSSPVQVPGTTWSRGSFSRYQTFAVKTDGTLWVWGMGSYGWLGLNSNTSYSSPKQVPGTTWNEVGAYLATKTDGTLWSWGYNRYGRIGTNESGSPGPSANRRATSRSSPTQVPGTTWKQGKSGSYNSHATKTDGTLWAWGANQKGELGQNNKTYYSSPVQIPGTTWERVYPSSVTNTGDWFVRAVKTDGTLWGWGNGFYGQLGVNSQIEYSSPIQIPGTYDTTTDGISNFGLLKL